MPWADGQFKRSNNQFTGDSVWQNDESAGFGIEWRRHDLHDQDIAQGINQCLNKNGENSMLAEFDLGGFKFTGLGDPVANSDIMTIGAANGDYVETDGSSTITADISFNNHKATGLAAATLDNDLVRKDQVTQNIEWAFISATGTATPTVIASSGGVSAINISNQITNVIFANNATTLDDQAFYFTSCSNAGPIYGRFPTQPPGAGQRTVNSVYVVQDQPSGLGIAQRDFVIIRGWN